MSESSHPLYGILARLDAAKIYYTLDRTRGDTVMILAQVPGRHYEIEVFTDGRIEVEVYTSNGHIGDHKQVEEFLKDFSD